MAKVRENKKDDNLKPEEPRASEETTRPTPDWEAYKGRVTLSLNEAVALSLSVRLDFSSSYEGIPCEGTEDELVSEFQRRLQVVEGHIRDGSLRAEKKSHVYDGAWERVATFAVDVASFRELAGIKGWTLPPGFPNEREKGKGSAWPWGTYETELLRHLAAAVQEFWTGYDPENPQTAPTNKKVEHWLKARGVADRVAEIMVQIIRADDAPRGPRPRS